MHILREEDMELFSRGQPEGESRTFNVKFTEEDEFISKGMMVEGFVPSDETLDSDRDGLIVTRFQYYASEIIYFGLGRVVTEQESFDVVQPFSLYLALRVLDVCDSDECPS